MTLLQQAEVHALRTRIRRALKRRDQSYNINLLAEAEFRLGQHLAEQF